MVELPITCECGRRHWSIGSMMTCRCEAVDEHGYPLDGAYELGNN